MRTSLMSEVLLNLRASIRVDAKYVLGFGVTDRIPKQLPASPWATRPAHHTTVWDHDGALLLRDHQV